MIAPVLGSIETDPFAGPLAWLTVPGTIVPSASESFASTLIAIDSSSRTVAVSLTTVGESPLPPSSPSSGVNVGLGEVVGGGDVGGDDVGGDVGSGDGGGCEVGMGVGKDEVGCGDEVTPAVGSEVGWEVGNGTAGVELSEAVGKTVGVGVGGGVGRAMVG